MIQSTGQRWDQTFMVGMQSDLALFQYWTSTLKINLIDYNRKNPGNPLIDENGELVLFP
jgi:hypothetical protein